MDYYSKNYKEFIKDTINVDMSDIYEVFLKDLPVNSLILDIGCGAGRDLKSFSDLGYRLIGLEPNEYLADFAHKNSGCEVRKISIEKINLDEKYDGIWACASLLHLNSNVLAKTLNDISQIMKTNSIFYCSFKYGNFEGERSGRFFNDQTLESFTSLLPKNLLVSYHWISKDKRPGREEEWLNLIIKKV